MCVVIGAADAKGNVELKPPMEGIKNVRFKKLDSSESDASLWAKSLITGATLAVVSVFLLGVLML